MASYNFQQSKGSYSVYTNNGNFSYSLKKYGKYAECMAKYSCETGIKLKNWFEEKDDYIVIYTYNKKDDKYLEILVSKDDYDLIKDYCWRAEKDKHEYYVLTEVGTAGKNKKKIKMHRLIMGVTNPDDKVDHIKGNGLDNRRCNLRVTTLENNNKNKVNLANNNTSGTTGIQFRYNSKDELTHILATWSVNGTTNKESFDVRKLGEEEALRQAKEYRQKMVEKYYKF